MAMESEDLHLLMILEARDMATAVIRRIRGELGALSGTQKLAAAGMVAGGIVSLEAAKGVKDVIVSGTKQAIDYSAKMTQLHTQAHATNAEVKRMYDYLLTNGPKLGVGPKDLISGLYNIESVASASSKGMRDLHGSTKDVVDAMAKLQLIATAGKPGEFDSKFTAQAIMNPLVLRMKTQAGGGTFKDPMQVAAAINKAVGYGDMRLPDFLTALNSGFLANLSKEGFDWRSTMAAFDTMTDAALPPQRAGIYLRQVGSNLTGAATKPKTEGMLESIGLSGNRLQTDARTGGWVKVISDLTEHLKSAGKMANVTALGIAAAFHAAVPKTKAEVVSMVDAIEGKLDHMNKGGKEKLAQMLGTANRTTSIHSGLEQLKNAIANTQNYDDQIVNILAGGARGGSALAILLSNPARLLQRYKDQGDPNSAASRADLQGRYKETLDTPQGKLSQFHASVQSFKIALGTGFLPVLTKVLTALNAILMPLATWTAHHKKLAAAIAASLFVFFTVAGVILLLSALWIVMAGAAAFAGIAIGATIATMAIWVVGITLLVIAIAAAVYLIIKHWKEVKAFFAGLGKFMVDVVRIAFDVIKALFWASVAAWLLPLKLLVDGFSAAFSWIPGVGSKLAGARSAFDSFYNGIIDKAKQAGRDAAAAARDAAGAWDKEVRKATPRLVSEHGTWTRALRHSPALVSEHGNGQMPKRPKPDPMPMNNPIAFVGWLGRSLYREFDKLLGFIGEHLALFITILDGGIYLAFTKLWPRVSSLTVRAWNDITGFLFVAWDRITSRGEMIFRDFSGWLGTLWGDIRNEALEAWGDIGDWFGDKWIAIKNGAIEAFFDVINWFRGLPGRIFDEVTALPGQLLDLGKWFMGEVWDGIIWGAQNAPGAIANVGTWIFDEITGLAGSAASWLYDKGVNAATGLWSGLQSGAQNAPGWVSSIGTWIFNAITSAAGAAAGWLEAKGENAAGGLWSGIQSGLSTAQSWVGNIGGTLRGLITGAGGWLTSLGSSAASGLWGGLQSGLQAAQDWTGKIANWMLASLGLLDKNGNLVGVKWLYGLGASIAKSLWNGLKWGLQHPGKLLDDLGKILEGVIKKLPGGKYLWGALSAAGKAAGAVGKAAGSVVNGARSLGSASTPDSIAADIRAAILTAQEAAVIALGEGSQIRALGVPQLASGALVRARPGGTLVNIGEGREDEAVLPLSALGARGGGGPTILMDFSGAQFLDDASINRLIDRLGSVLTKNVLPGVGMAVRRS